MLGEELAGPENELRSIVLGLKVDAPGDEVLNGGVKVDVARTVEDGIPEVVESVKILVGIGLKEPGTLLVLEDGLAGVGVTSEGEDSPLAVDERLASEERLGSEESIDVEEKLGIGKRLGMEESSGVEDWLNVGVKRLEAGPSKSAVEELKNIPDVLLVVVEGLPDKTEFSDEENVLDVTGNEGCPPGIDEVLNEEIPLEDEATIIERVSEILVINELG